MSSKESLTILIQLVNLAQKRGAYSVEESYLAFMAMKEFINDPKLDRAEKLVEELFNKDKKASGENTEMSLSEIADKINVLNASDSNN
jgi:hypothetical protein